MFLVGPSMVPLHWVKVKVKGKGEGRENADIGGLAQW